MSEEIMRQSYNPSKSSSPEVRPKKRITRGFSDLPKEEPKVVSSSSEEEEDEEQESSGVPKIKKIHHMTLKALERKKKIADKIHETGISADVEKPVEKLPARRRGRPRGSRRIEKEDKEDYMANFDEESPDEEENQLKEKKEINLRKRNKAKQIIDNDSDELQRLNDLKQVDIVVEIKPKQANATVPIKIEGQEGVVPAGPKKRGRKKKIQPEAIPPPVTAAVPQAKVYTVPKAQTYNNYHKFFSKLT